MIRITRNISFDQQEIHFDFVRSSGPGGQNVNKVATAVQLRLDVRNSPSLPEEVKTRLLKLAGERVTREGVLVLDARRYRSQDRNRQDAMERLVSIVKRAARKPQKRIRTKPSTLSKEKRLRNKKQRGEIKKLRSEKIHIHH